MNKIAGLTLLFSTAYGSLGFAHNEDLPSDTSPPRIGTMSEEVVREKFASYGQKILDLNRDGNIYHIRAEVAGREMQLNLNSLTGIANDNDMPLHLEPGAQVSNIVIKPDPRRVPWSERAIRFDHIGVRGLTPPTEFTPQR